MPRLTLDITMSLDGFIAGPNRTLEKPLGEGADHLHDWLTSLDVFRERHGGSGGVTNDDSAVVEEQLASTGAVIMGRRMFSGGAGPWADDPNAGGWWGDDPPFRVPVFVLTRHAREPVVKQGDDRLGAAPAHLEQKRVIHSPAVTHLRYRVVR
jgi:dihydrofolate reductase